MPAGLSPDSSTPFLKDLNPAQLAAVQAAEGPVMIIAGAGSGKTRALTYRVAYLISLGVRPYEILALTFTNKAAKEMKSRIVDLVGPKSQEVWMGTFHSIFARILRVESQKIGFGRNFTIYDSDDSLSLIKSIMGSLGIPQQQFNPHAIRARISLMKNQVISPREYRRRAGDLFEETTAQVYEEYDKKLRANNAMDFDDLLIKPIELFERHPQTLEKYQHRFKYILVDEYQDTNRAQYFLIQNLAADHRNVCVVGDDAQSIYSFRGADIRNILDFEKDYPDCKVFRLEQNYRSSRMILAAADQVIKKNREQIQKNLWTTNPMGESITVLECEDEKDEGYQIAERIQHLSVKLKLDLKSFAILYRTNAQSRSLEDGLRRSGIPYTIVGGVEFYKRKEIKDILAYLKVIVNPRDDESLLRIINYPPRGIGATTVQKLRSLATRYDKTLFEVLLENKLIREFSGRMQSNLQQFANLLTKYAQLKLQISASELARALVDDLGILREFKSEGTPEAMARWENVQELLSAITEFSRDGGLGTLANFLEEVSLISDIDTWIEERNAVTLMTLHSAKGLEFPVVFIAGLEEGLLPFYPAEIDRVELEEERRLFYVGMTRTMRKLFLTYTQSRVRYGEVTFPVRSRFLDEISPELLHFERGSAKRRGHPRREAERTRGAESSRLYSIEREYVPAIEQDFHQEGSDRAAVLRRDSTGAKRIKVGCIVEHESFGRGQVLLLTGRGESAKAVVKFEHYGQKHLMLKYANLKLL